MCSEKADGAGLLWVQNVAIFISNHQIQIQNSKQDRRNGRGLAALKGMPKKHLPSVQAAHLTRDGKEII